MYFLFACSLHDGLFQHGTSVSNYICIFSHERFQFKFFPGMFIPVLYF